MGLLQGSPVVYAIAGLLVLGIVYSALYTPTLRRHGVPLRKPSDTLPLLGNGLRFLQPRQKLLSWFVQCQKQAGYETLQLAVPTLPPGVVINDPRNLDFVFRNEGTLISKGSFVKGMLWDLFGHGIVNADGDVWRVQRKAGQAFLNTTNIRVLTDVALPRFLGDTLARLRQQAAAATAEPVDLQAVFHELTSCIMGKMAYNMEMHADDEFTMAFDFASGATTERFQNPLWFVTEALTGAAALRRSLAVVKTFGRRIVASAVADREAQHGGGGGKDKDNTSTSASSDSKLDKVSGSLIQSLLDAISDQDVVADAALNYLSAGRDTVAQGLTWTFYMLMKHPRVVQKMRQEVRCLLDGRQASLGGGQNSADSTDPADPPGPPDATALDVSYLTPAALPYTMAVFYEGLRLFPPIPFEIKQVEASQLELPDGTVLPRGALILWCSWALNRSQLTWGEDAEAFRPERWLTVEELPTKSGGDRNPGTGSMNSGSTSTSASNANANTNNTRPRLRLINRSASEFPVFHGGPRTCLGKKMAESMAVQVMAAVAWHFDMSPAVAEGEDVSRFERVTKTSLTLPMEGGLPCYVRLRATDVVV